MVVISSKIGQLGNRILLFAHFIANAIEHGYVVLNPGFDEFAPLFVETERSWLSRFPASTSHYPASAPARLASYTLFRLAEWLAWHGPRNPWIRSIRVETLLPDGELDLASSKFQEWRQTTKVLIAHGWRYRDHTGLWKHRDAVRAFFTPVQPIRSDVETLIGTLRRDQVPLVGVHIRQGDYRVWREGKFYYETSQYAALMRRAREQFSGGRVRFLVCSNLHQEPAALGDLDWRAGLGHPLKDMYALAACDYLIGPPSTFTGWASFYGQVPLYRVRDPQAPFTLDSFGVYGYRPPTI